MKIVIDSSIRICVLQHCQKAKTRHNETWTPRVPTPCCDVDNP